MRQTLLFRTVLHEIGHYVDWLESVIWPTLDLNDPIEAARIEQAFTTKSSQMKEDFAHRYAAARFADLQRQGRVPFPAILDRNSMQHDRLQANWFIANAHS